MQRESWKSKTGFLLAAIGSAIGLGNIWRFPQMAYENGGGAFLIPYIIALFIVGIPILIMEFGIAHKLRGSAPSVFERIKLKSGKKSFQYLGWFGVSIAMFGVLVYYSVVIGWCLYYLVAGLGLIDINAIKPVEFFLGIIGKGGFGDFSAPGMWIFICVVVVWLINLFLIFRGVERGIERANKIMMPLMFVIVLILVIRSAFLPGAGDGITAYLVPKFSKLLDGNVWKSAFSQIFFTLSLSFGIMIAYASYLPKKTDIKKNALTTALINSGFSLIVGFLVFSVMGYYANQAGLSVGKAIGTGGVGLAFITFPTAIQKMGGAGHFFWILFFLCLFFAGLSSSLSLLESFVSSIRDKTGISRTKATLYSVTAGFIISIIFVFKGAGVNILDTVDHAMNNYGLVLVGIFNTIVIGWIYKAKVLRRHISATDGVTLGRWWNYCIKYITPSTLIIIFIWGVISTVMKKSTTYLLVGLAWFAFILIIAYLFTRVKWKNKDSLTLGHHYEDEDNPLPYAGE